MPPAVPIEYAVPGIPVPGIPQWESCYWVRTLVLTIVSKPHHDNNWLRKNELKISRLITNYHILDTSICLHYTNRSIAKDVIMSKYTIGEWIESQSLVCNTLSDHWSDPLLGIFICKSYVLFLQRNCVNHDRHEGTFISLKSAKDTAENLRQKGTSFSIVERPAIIFSLSRSLFVMSEVGKYNNSTYFNGTICDKENDRHNNVTSTKFNAIGLRFSKIIVRLLSRKNWNQYRRPRLDFTSVPFSEIHSFSEPCNFRTHHSKSDGSCYLLSWTDYIFDVDIARTATFISASIGLSRDSIY